MTAKKPTIIAVQFSFKELLQRTATNRTTQDNP